MNSTIHNATIRFNNKRLRFDISEKGVGYLIRLSKTEFVGTKDKTVKTQSIELTLNEFMILYGELAMMMHSVEFGEILNSEPNMKEVNDLNSNIKIICSYDAAI